MPNNIELIREFIAAWSSLDARRLASYFSEDGCYHNMPSRPVRGRANVEAFIATFIAQWTRTEWDIISIAADDNRVFCERLDRTETTAGNVDLPCLGVFTISDGKIQEWRDYFDLATYTRAISTPK